MLLGFFFFKNIVLNLHYAALSPNSLSLLAIKCTLTSATVQLMSSEWISYKIKVIFLYIKSTIFPKYHNS